jgi:hypothetical protein
MSTFIPFDPEDQVLRTDRVYTSAWTGLNELVAAYTSSTQANWSSVTSSAQFYLNVYNTNPDTDPDSEVQYTISYGNRYGSGSQDFDNNTGGEGFSPSRAIYSQYRNIVFGGDETQYFNFDGHTPDDIYIININRARYKQSLRVGNIALQLSGSTRLLKLTDDSVTTSGSATLRPGVGREFTLVSGSNGIRLGSSNVYVTNSGSYGKVYPDAGFIILNADALDATAVNNGIALGTGTSPNDNAQNNKKLQEAIRLGESFIIDSQENISSKYYFVRAKNTQFNYTTNDSFTDANGVLKFNSMVDNPQVYITTVGLYNNNLDLLAVAKLSQPLPKNFTKEALIKVKLDY